MSSEFRPREHPIVNPEHLTTAAREVVNAWLLSTLDKDRDRILNDGIATLAKLLHMERRDVTSLKASQ